MVNIQIERKSYRYNREVWERSLFSLRLKKFSKFINVVAVL